MSVFNKRDILEEDETKPQQQRLSDDECLPGTIIAETHHSVITPCRYSSMKAVTKRCRHGDKSHPASRFLKELEALKLVGVHRNIAQLLDHDISHATLTLRFEPGKSLDRYADTDMKSTLAPSDCTILWTQMSSALAHLHNSCFLIHDDVKPDTITWDSLSQDGVLIDFGAALDTKTLPENFFNASGTPPYAPPEYLQRRKGLEGDVWALGVTMLFTFGYMPLPYGEWILPEVFEKEDARREMVEWLDEVERWRRALGGGDMALLAEMSEAIPDARIRSDDLACRPLMEKEHLLLTV